MCSLCALWSPPCHLPSAFINQTVPRWRSELPNAFIHVPQLSFYFIFLLKRYEHAEIVPPISRGAIFVWTKLQSINPSLQEALFATGGTRQLNPHCLSLAFCGRRGTALGKIQMGTEDIRAVLIQGLAAQ